MAKRYEVTVCSGPGECEVLGSFRDEEKAKKAAARAVKKRAKARRKDKVPVGGVHAEVRGVERGIYDSQPVYEAEERYGPPKPRSKPRRRANPEPEDRSPY